MWRRRSEVKEMGTDKGRETATHWLSHEGTRSQVSWGKGMGIDRVRLRENPWETRVERVRVGLWGKLEVS